MWRPLTLLSLALLSTGLPHNSPRRNVTDSLSVDNGLGYGDWGPIEHCLDGSFVTAFEVKFEPYSILDIDETAVNAVRLYCSTAEHIMTGHVMSTEGNHGDWQGLKHCSTGFATGLRAKVLQPQGGGDDVGVQNVELSCEHSNEVITGVPEEVKIPEGKWSSWSKCREGAAICGIETRYDSSGLGDDSGMTNLAMFCCAFNQTLVH